MQEMILFHDENLLIVNKPAGLVTHATLDKKRDNLVDLLKRELNLSYLGLIHRLDKDTSGAILFTLKEEANIPVQKMLENREIKKTYQALVSGHLEWSGHEQKWEDFLKKERRQGIELMSKVTKGGVKAISLLKDVKHFNHTSLLELELVTGRMHQLRIQTSVRGHAIVGDTLYGDRSRQEVRMFLHSSKMILKHPVTNSPLTIIAPLPPEFEQRVLK